MPNTVIEEKKFIEEALKILESLGCKTHGLTEKKILKIMEKKGYKHGYKGVWISSDDIIPDEQ